MKRPPKVTRVEFADGKVVRFRQEGGNLLIEWKNRGCDWKALEPVALEPWETDEVSTEVHARNVRNVRENALRSHPIFEQASRSIRQEMERDLLTGRNRVAFRQPNQGSVVDFTTITSSMPEVGCRLGEGDRIGIDIVPSESVPVGGAFLRCEDEIMYRHPDGAITRGVLPGRVDGAVVYRSADGGVYRWRDAGDQGGCIVRDEGT